METDTTAHARFDELQPLARDRAFHYEVSYMADRGDFLTAALMGAWKAALTFDPDKGASLRTWGRHKIDGAIIDEFRADVASRGGSRHEHYRIALLSLDDLLTDDDGAPHDTFPDPESARPFEEVDAAYDAAVADVLGWPLLRLLECHLPEQEWDILKSWACDGEFMKSIGARYGVSESRICQRMREIRPKAARIVARYWHEAA